MPRLKGGIRCPSCSRDDANRVLDSRADGTKIRRRRMCVACDARFTTEERLVVPTTDCAGPSAGFDDQGAIGSDRTE